MQDVKWYVSRLRSMTAAEILWRVRSLLRDQFDAVRIASGRLPGLDPAKVPAPAEFQPGFRCSTVDGRQWAEGAEAAWQARLFASADAILRNELSYFDQVNRFHGEPFDWHRDISAGKSSSRALSLRIDYRDFERNGDCKIVWEPNRHHQLVVLARAFRATGDRRYAQKVHELLDGWLEANPFGYGMNWKSPLEVGVRIINWTYALDLLGDDGRPDNPLWTRLLETVHLSVWDTQRKYSRGSSSNNHLIGEAAGVYIACAYFDALPDAERYKADAKRVLEAEIFRQTFSDGCTAEHAFGYQFFVMQFFLYCALAGDATGDSFSKDFMQRLHTMYRFIADISADTGSPPYLGDADSGYVLDLGDLPDDPQALISVAASVFDDPDLAGVDDTETAFWLFGDKRRLSSGRRAPASSSAYRESGYFVMRSSDGAGRTSVFVDCAELGYGAIAAHGHADCLSVCVSFSGTPFIVDAGTYDYFTYPEWRQYFRSTRAHNTVEIDGADQSVSTGPFMFAERAAAKLLVWQETDATVVFEGEHDGYKRLDDPVAHKRRIELDRASGDLLIVDTLEAAGAHEIALHFHIAPAWSVGSLSDRAVRLEADQRAVELTVDRGEIEILEAGADQKAGWISDGYHRKTPSICIRVSDAITGSATITTSMRECGK